MYFQNQLKKDVISLLEKAGVENPRLEKPPGNLKADIAFPCFELAREQKKSPVEIGSEIASKIKPSGLVAEIKAEGPYVNFYSDEKKMSASVLTNVLELKKGYGSANLGKGKNALVEHTSINPNASPHVGRVRNAIIGDSLCRLLEFCNYKVSRYYYVNDVGKQIAMLVYGVKNMDLKKLKFNKVLDVYVDVNRKIEKNPEIEKELFKLLHDFEKGDKKTRNSFRDIVDLCLKGQLDILKKLDISFDHFNYESRYLSGETEKILKSIEKRKKIFVDENNRKVLDLKGYDIPMDCPVLVLTRNDGTSLYQLRDLAYNIEKHKKAGSGRNIIILGEDQKLYFRQIASALDILGYPAPEVVHYSFVLLQEKKGTSKMSTRKGTVVLLDDFLNEAEKRATAEIKKRFPELEKEEVKRRAESIATGAVRFSMIRISPEKNVLFDWEEALNFEGSSAPYLQYTYARASSILRKSKRQKFDSSLLNEKEEQELIKKMADFPQAIEYSALNSAPHIIANYLIELAQKFNIFYEKHPVLKAENNLKKSRLALVEAAGHVLKNGMNILGIRVLERM